MLKENEEKSKAHRQCANRQKNKNQNKSNNIESTKTKHIRQRVKCKNTRSICPVKQGQ